MKKFGTPIWAAPGSAIVKVGLAGVGVPSGAWSALGSRCFALARSRLAFFLTRPLSDCVLAPPLEFGPAAGLVVWPPCEPLPLPPPPLDPPLDPPPLGVGTGFGLG